MLLGDKDVKVSILDSLHGVWRECRAWGVSTPDGS